MKTIIFNLFAAILALSGPIAYGQTPMSSDNGTTPDSISTVAETATSAGQTLATRSGEELAQSGDSAYAADNFVLAGELYTEAMKTGGSSAVLFYNLGNVYYRQGNLGKAIVNYERALKLDPTNADARENLAFVKSKITDRQIEEGSIMTTLWHNIVGVFTADAWAWIAVTLFALFLGALSAYLFSSVIIVKKICFFGGIVLFLLCGASIIVSFAAADRMENDTDAIILPPSAQLSTTPREARTRSEEAFLLHEGTKVEIVDSVATTSDGKWYEVKVGTGDRAWIKASEVERI